MKSVIINSVAILFKFIPPAVRWLLWDLIKPFSQKIFLLIRYGIAKNELSACGENVYFGSNVIIKNAKGIAIGNNVSVHDGCYLDGYGGIEIGSNVSIAHATSILSSNHTWHDDKTPIKYNKAEKSGVFISDDVWIGCGVRLLAGAKIGERCVIAAGSVVTAKEIDAGALWGGVPAKQIKNIK
ncbi:acyltransferase [Halomonas sp. MA07-2]|uniref:acyltransferase n=1 Tax=Halomonas sp. MA07-2 TaxID=3440841 RepID=UPI003EECC65A